MESISFPFVRPWTVYIPSVIRYLDDVFVDAFFEKGTLRLSSFKKFRQHTDEQRGDTGEGSISMEIHTPNSHHVVAGYNGQEVYVLCGSTINSSEVMKAFGGAGSGIKINKPLSFAEAVSRKIPEFVGGFQGSCIYTDERSVRRDSPYIFSPPPENDEAEGEKWAEDNDRFLAQQNPQESLLLKPMRYANQSEYRFLWFATGLEKDHIDIECPEARQFCEKVTYPA